VPAAPSRGGVLRLTSAQIRNGLRDVLGADVPVPVDLDADVSRHGFSALGARDATLSARDAEALEPAALAAVRATFASDRRRKALVPCATAGAPDEACARSVLQKAARRAFRRALADKEEEPYLAVWRAVRGPSGGAKAEGHEDGWGALEYALAALLQSPKFLFRMEQGVPDPKDPARRLLTGYELAARLSFFLWNTGPDEAGLEAARRGALDTPQGLATELERMLASPMAREGLGAFFDERMDVARLGFVAKDGMLFPKYTTNLIAAMKREPRRLFEHLVLEQQADVLDLLDTRVAFVDKELAALYGVPAPTGGSSDSQPVTLPPDSPRVGVLTRGAFLAAQAHATTTSPTLRGKFVQERWLCTEIPAPPPDVDTALPDDPAGNLTTRGKLEAHGKDPVCAGCHRLMDPLGLAFENFDPVGAWRDKEKGKAVDPTGTFESQPFETPAALAALIKQSPRTGACFVRDLFRAAVAHEDRPAHADLLRALTARFEATGRKLRPLVRDVVITDSFRTISAP
jgi:hypothetical protein